MDKVKETKELLIQLTEKIENFNVKDFNVKDYDKISTEIRELQTAIEQLQSSLLWIK